MFYNSTCVSTCITNLYAFEGKCVGCISPCNTCKTTPTECTSCIASSTTPFLQGQACTSQCQSGYYGDSILGQCVECTSPCKTCTSKSNCLSCINTPSQNYYFLSNNCLTACLVGYYAEGFVCKQCSSGCLKCT